MAVPFPAIVDAVENVDVCPRSMARSTLFPVSARKSVFPSKLRVRPPGLLKAAHGPFASARAAEPLPASVVTPQNAAELADGCGVADCVRDARDVTLLVTVAAATEREALGFEGETDMESFREGVAETVDDVDADAFTEAVSEREKALEIDGDVD